MPTVTLNRKTFEDLVGKKLPEQELKDRISMLGTDLDDVTTNDIIVEIFPNRPDMLSEQGFARAFSAFIGHKPGLRAYKIAAPKGEVIIEQSVERIRPRIACALVQGLRLSEEKIREIIQIQEKLHTTYGRHRKKCAIGIYPLEHITLPITYTAKKPEAIQFTPLEGDREMTATEILTEHPTGKEYAHLLEDEKTYPLFIDGVGKVLSMPPIINSEMTGRVTEDTKAVFVECSGYEQRTVTRCLNMIITALADMGGQVEAMQLKYPKEQQITPDLTPQEMELDLGYINKRLGLDLDTEKATALLERMGHRVKGKTVQVPAWRADIMHPVDLVEEIAIAHGYEHFTPTMPAVATVGMEEPFEIFKRRVTELLVGLGLLELNTYHIVNEKTQRELMDCEIPVVRLANALNEEYNVLRAWMVPCLLEVLSQNKHHAYPQNLFDIGVMFKEGKSETGVEEFERLGVVYAHEDADYTQARQGLEYLFRHFGITGQFRAADHDSFIIGRCARVSVQGKDVAYCGEISPSVLEHFDLQVPVSGFELNLTELYKIVEKK